MSQFRTLNVDVVVNGETMRIDKHERTEFVQLYGLDQLIPNRYSEILIVNLMKSLELIQDTSLMKLRGLKLSNMMDMAPR